MQSFTPNAKRSLSLVSREANRHTTVVRSFGPIKRPWTLTTWFRAWVAVRSGLRVDEFLRGRKAAYELQAAPDDAELPQLVDVSLGRVVTVHNPRYCDPLAPSDGTPHPVIPALRAMRALPTEQPAALAMQRRIGQALERRDRALEEFEALKTRALPDAPRPPERDAPELRPLLPSALPMAVSGVGAALVMAIEGFQFALPFLDAVGVNSRALSTEIHRATTLVLQGFGFAFCLALGLLVTAHVALRSVRAIEAGPSSPRALVSHAVRVLSVGGLAVGGVWCAAAMRHGVSEASSLLLSGDAAGGIQTGAFSLFGLIFTVAAAVLSHIAETRYHERTLARDAQARWDALRAREASEDRALADGHAALITAHESALARAHAQVASTSEVLDRLIDDACSQEKQAATRILLREAYAQAFVSGLASVLELERAAFARHAYRRNRTSLLTVPHGIEDRQALPEEPSGSRRIAH
jgi:hypothetical protein